MAFALAGLWERALSIALPPTCLGCGLRVTSAQRLCASCWSAMPMVERPYCERLGTPFAYPIGEGALSPAAIADPPRYGRARFACRYDGLAVELVQALKYGDKLDVAELLGTLMARAGAEVLAGADLIVPVPLHRWRLFRRRFNQAAVLADVVSRLSGVARDPFCLERRRATPHQVGLTKRQRLANVQGAFAVPAEARQRLAGRRVVLVDDVVTTGATVDAAVAALLRAGARQVDVLAFARVIAGT